MTNHYIRPGAEPFSFAGGDTGLLLIHGFFGTPEELRPLGEALAGRGYSVEGVLLARHGGPPAGQRGVRWQEWVASAEQELVRLQHRCRRTVIVGFSMGALVACHLAPRHRTAGLALLAPALKLHNEYQLRLAGVAQYLLPWLRPYAKADLTNPQVQTSIREFLPDADFTDPATQEWLRRDLRLPTGALYELIKLQDVVKRNLWRISAPLLVLQGRLDTTVQPAAAELAVAKAASRDKRLLWFERSGHMLANGVEGPQVWSALGEWLGEREW